MAGWRSSPRQKDSGHVFGSRSLDTAQKVVVGAALLAKVRKPEEVQLRAWLLQFLKAEVTRQADVTRILPLINELEALPGQ